MVPRAAIGFAMRLKIHKITLYPNNIRIFKSREGPSSRLSWRKKAKKPRAGSHEGGGRSTSVAPSQETCQACPSYESSF